MFENIISFFKKLGKKEQGNSKSKESSDTAKERLHLVLMQDRANVSADFLELMKQEIIEVIKKYIDIDEKAIDVRLTNKSNEDGTVGAPALYANIPIVTIKNEARKVDTSKVEDKKENDQKIEQKDKPVSTEETKKDEKEENKEVKLEDNKDEVKEEKIEEPSKQEEKVEPEGNKEELNEEETKIEETVSEEIVSEEDTTTDIVEEEPTQTKTEEEKKEETSNV